MMLWKVAMITARTSWEDSRWVSLGGPRPTQKLKKKVYYPEKKRFDAKHDQNLKKLNTGCVVVFGAKIIGQF